MDTSAVRDYLSEIKKVYAKAGTDLLFEYRLNDVGLTLGVTVRKLGSTSKEWYHGLVLGFTSSALQQRLNMTLAEVFGRKGLFLVSEFTHECAKLIHVAKRNVGVRVAADLV